MGVQGTMLTRKEVERAVADCATCVYGLEDFDFAMETKLVDERVGGDTLDAVLVIMACKEKFNVAIPEYESERMETLGDIAKYIFAHQNETGL